MLTSKNKNTYVDILIKYLPLSNFKEILLLITRCFFSFLIIWESYRLAIMLNCHVISLGDLMNNIFVVLLQRM